jgi:hypothetical protein
MTRNMIRMWVCGGMLALSLVPGPASGQGTPRAFSLDVIWLTFSLQQGIVMDTALAIQIESALAAARTVNDSLKLVHEWSRYTPGCMSVEAQPGWKAAWDSGRLQTGNAAIDSLGAYYGLTTVKWFSRSYYTLSFSRAADMQKLAARYMQAGSPWAGACAVLGDGDRIWLSHKNNGWQFVFSLGWGDCPSGCTARCYWYVEVDSNGHASFVGSLANDYSGPPAIWPYNIPSRYQAAVFSSADDILARTHSADWWVRRYAVFVLRLFFEKSERWTYEPDEALFNALRSDVRSSRDRVLRRLIECCSDPDPDVRKEAIDAVRIILRSTSSKTCYYPLAVGNSWTFRTSFNRTFTETITFERTGASGHRLFQFDTCRGISKVELAFPSDNRLYLSLDDREQLWLRFDSGAGYRWKTTVPGHDSTDSWMVTLESTTDSVTVPAGHFENLYRFHYSWIGADNDWVEWYAPFVGPVKRTLLGFAVIDEELVSCTLDTLVMGREPTPAASPSDVELVSLFPNPSSLYFNAELRVSAPSARIRMTITDMLGRVRVESFDGTIARGMHPFGFYTSNLPSGIYSLHVQHGDRLITRWFAVTH